MGSRPRCSRAWPSGCGGPGRARAEFDRVVRERLAAFDAVRARPVFYLDRYRVRYVALPITTGPTHPGRDWRRAEVGPNWQV
jgi:hypothetical protein